APLIEMAERAEAASYDSVWVGDSLLAPSAPSGRTAWPRRRQNRRPDERQRREEAQPPPEVIHIQA
ncbi:MAG: hypothetical protein Q8Q58_09375, partial [Candidatus Rokubacteria bacterium]|nr:hypothetical protein [Candidatus Rokubacteria bacterium]